MPSLKLNFGIDDDQKIAFRNNISKNFVVDTEPMGARRTLGTAGALVLGLAIGYTAILYILPFATPRQILGISQQNYAAAALEKTNMGWFRNTLLRPFEIRKTFLGKGQSIRAHYVIPKGMEVDLRIEKCARIMIIEAHKCKVVGQSQIKIKGGIGTRKFKFGDVAFYRFDDRLRSVDDVPVSAEAREQGYRIIWVRD